MRKASPDQVCEEALAWAKALPPVRRGPGCSVCSLPADIKAGLDAIRSFGPKIGSQYLATKGFKILPTEAPRSWTHEVIVANEGNAAIDVPFTVKLIGPTGLLASATVTVVLAG